MDSVHAALMCILIASRHLDAEDVRGFDGIPEGFRPIYPGKFGLFSDAPCNLFDAAGVTSVSRMLGEK